MTGDASAEVFYGYTTALPENDKLNNYVEKAEKIGLDVVELDEINENGDRTLIFGKKIKVSDVPDTESVSADEFLNKITTIAKSEELMNIEEDLNIKSKEPRLIIAGRLVE